MEKIKRTIMILYVLLLSINIFSQNVRYVRSFGHELDLKSPESVSVNISGEIYIADTGNNRIIKLDKGRIVSDEMG